ncbi:MAG: cell division protein FtsA [Patescibacteria group bacterium]|nr:cell division protein FtsA [Patescibacteria group bacterium]
MQWKGNNAGEFITGLDIGTSTVKVAVAEPRNGRLALIHVDKEQSAGMRKGAIVEIPEVSHIASRVLADVKKLSKSAARNIYLAMGSPQVKMQLSRGIVAVSHADGEIYQDDVDRAVRASQAVNLPQNRTILHTLTREYIVDGVGDIADPLGLSGNRLEVQSIIIDVFSPHVKGLMNAVELAGGEISGLYLSPLMAARAALSKRQKDLGTALIEIGHGTTGLAVYEENKLVAVAKFPVGTANLANDLGVGLKIPVDAAEEIMLKCGSAIAKEVNLKDQVELGKYAPDAKGFVSRRFVAEIIQSRLEEIFDFVNAELKACGKAGELPGGVVLVGGGAKLPGITDLAKQELKLSCQLGCALSSDWESEGGAFKEYLEDPEFAGVFGLVLWGMDQEGWGRGGRSIGGAKGAIRNVFKYFTP